MKHRLDSAADLTRYGLAGIRMVWIPEYAAAPHSGPKHLGREIAVRVAASPRGSAGGVGGRLVEPHAEPHLLPGRAGPAVPHRIKETP